MKIIKKYVLTTLLLSIFASGYAQGQPVLGINKLPRVIVVETFSTTLDTAKWKVELQGSPGSFVGTRGGKLILETGEGVTVWLKEMLHGQVKISYDRKIIMNGGSMDRLSDLNQFWMAADPGAAAFFNRNGRLESYDSLKLYYVGMGGNYNKTTRFRRYDGKGNRVLIGEYTDQQHLLKPNKLYHIDLIVSHGEVSFWVDQHKYFSYQDADVLKEGYFGFRATKSHQEISNLKITQLP